MPKGGTAPRPAWATIPAPTQLFRAKETHPMRLITARLTRHRVATRRGRASPGTPAHHHAHLPVALLAAPTALGGHGTLLAAASIAQVISNTTAWIVGILAGVATLFLTIGGVRYLMAGGDPGEVEKAKTALKSAAIGYGLAVLAPVIVTVLKSLVGG
jgi:hypothetical protein